MASYAHGFGSKRAFTYADTDGHEHEIKPYLSPRHYRGDPSRIEIVSGPLVLGLPFLAAGLFLVPYQMVDFLVS
ncbi:hypothetical protein [Streptomyces sp. NPDC046832]|uniref:hypothetical protein n=1 Tax=Streptomyces sp. NPDC046832 TaxID=3155020 RepID=UPI0033C1CDA3